MALAVHRVGSLVLRRKEYSWFGATHVDKEAGKAFRQPSLSGSVADVKKRWVAVALLSFSVLLILTLTWPPEPTYQRRLLSEWLALLPKTAIPLSQVEEVANTENAVRQIGTKGVPFMMKWLRYERPPWRKALL